MFRSVLLLFICNLPYLYAADAHQNHDHAGVENNPRQFFYSPVSRNNNCSPAAQENYDKGDNCIDNGQYEEAIKYLNDCINQEKNPESELSKKANNLLKKACALFDVFKKIKDMEEENDKIEEFNKVLEKALNNQASEEELLMIKQTIGQKISVNLKI